MRVRYSAGLCLVFALIAYAPAVGQVVQINSFSQMPPGASLLLVNNGGLWPPDGPNGLYAVLGSQGITVTGLDGVPIGGWSAETASFFSDPNSTIAPSGDTIIFTPIRLTFSQPIYAVGATFAFTPGSSDPNLPDAVFRVEAFDASGNVIGDGYSSSSSQSNGPVAIHIVVGNPSYEFTTSFAGVWSETPIAYATFTRADATAPPRGDWSALSFSSTPPVRNKALVQPPINGDGTSVFSSRRAALPVKFSLLQNDVPTCALSAATIAVTRTAGNGIGVVDPAAYEAPPDNGTRFGVAECQYVYILAARSLGLGTYRVDISINGIVVGHAVFALK